MIDPTLIDRAKQYDPLPFAERYTSLKRVASTAGGEYAGPCPMCGGRDRFRVQPLEYRWLCRTCTDGKWRDVIALYRAITGAPFAEAVTALTGGGLPPAPTRRVEPAAEPKRSGALDPKWQARAQAVIAEAESALWNDAGERARQWLNARGLADETLRRWNVGYIPGERWERSAEWGLTGSAIKIDRGILIPCIVSGAIWYLKIRRPAGEPKYTQIRGGSPALFMADTFTGAHEACVTEGEFDSMLLWQCLQHATNPRWRSLGVATLGSKSNRLDLDQWARYLYPIRHLLIMYDQDGKSEEAKGYWQQIAGRAFVVRWTNIGEGDKDLTDYHLSGGRLLDLASWGVMQAEYATNPDGLDSNMPPALPDLITNFVSEAGLAVTGLEREGETIRVSIGRAAEIAPNCP